MQNTPPPPSITLTIDNLDVDALAAVMGLLNLSVNITATASNIQGHPDDDDIPHLPTPPTHSPYLPSSAPATPRRQGRRSALHQALPLDERNSAHSTVFRDPPSSHWIHPEDPRASDPRIDRYYVVVRGRCTGIFDDWFYVEDLVRGLQAHSIHRRFPTFEQAWAAYQGAKARGTVRCIDRNGPLARRYHLLYGPVEECMQ